MSITTDLPDAVAGMAVITVLAAAMIGAVVAALVVWTSRNPR